eukprot:13419321-Alexandrium_andersonii.AAC.1
MCIRDIIPPATRLPPRSAQKPGPAQGQPGRAAELGPQAHAGQRQQCPRAQMTLAKSRQSALLRMFA